MDTSIHDHSGSKPNRYIVSLILILSITGILYSFSGKSSTPDAIKGTVKEISAERNTVLDMGSKEKMVQEQDLLVEIQIDGSTKNIEVLNDYKPVSTGDEIFVSGALFGDDAFNVVNISRFKELIYLLVFFTILVIVTGGWKGVYSLIGLTFSFAVIFVFIVPLILKGFAPVGVGIAGAAVILTPALYLSYGLNKKSIAAFLGIIIALFFVGIVANYFIGTLQFTGFSSELAVYLDMEAKNAINLIGLIIAGIIIAAVGVLDDVAVIQSSVVFSLAGANSNLRGFKLFKEAMHVGKDHISAVVNTLVLAYTGASLPLIILLYLRKMPVDYFLSLEMVAEEVARTLISSSGLLLAVPLTTIIAVFMVDKKYNNLKK